MYSCATFIHIQHLFFAFSVQSALPPFHTILFLSIPAHSSIIHRQCKPPPPITVDSKLMLKKVSSINGCSFQFSAKNTTPIYIPSLHPTKVHNNFLQHTKQIHSTQKGRGNGETPHPALVHRLNWDLTFISTD